MSVLQSGRASSTTRRRPLAGLHVVQYIEPTLSTIAAKIKQLVHLRIAAVAYEGGEQLLSRANQDGLKRMYAAANAGCARGVEVRPPALYSICARHHAFMRLRDVVVERRAAKGM